MPLILSLLIIFCLFLLIPTAYAGLIGAPWVPARSVAINKAFKKIGISEKDVVVDLGAGDGKILFAAEKLGARAYGFELSPIMWFVARLRALRHKNVKVHFGNFYNKSLSDVTVIYAFLMPETMSRVHKYLVGQNIPNGRFLMAYTFGFKDVAPLDIIKEENCGTIYIYDLKELTKESQAR